MTNSDDRVPDVLTSLGVKVSPLRFGVEPQQAVADEEDVSWDVDLSVMSYDVGVEKPDRGIFEAAEQMVPLVPGLKGEGVEEWERIYVGDEYAKDVVGAIGAGWKAVLIDYDAPAKDDLRWRDEDPPSALDELFDSSNAVGFRSLTKFAEWLR